MTTSRTMTLGSAVTAAALLALTGCANEPVEHGEIIDKRGYAGRWIPDYEDVYRQDCSTIRTSSFTTTAFAGRSGGSSGSKSSGGKTSSSGSTGKKNDTTPDGSGGSSGGTPPGKSLTNGGTSGTTQPGSSGSTTDGSSQPTQQCQRHHVGRKQTGQHWQPGKWELQLRDGDRTGWITVSETTYSDTDLHDHI
ncbi:hypothetical protein [Streptomyces sp. AVP053U2]|uniref:hypothetical protein n=1 Tax=Streptomyces sp. AVP053U2 TaxID=1737066 RepID=UPI00073C2ED8|nr:hypothetical protein [Streptomyces sp. AVP053U2]ODA69792.1 hypothetical protein APS67_006009 [Streptomyces sp. AVP053U2]